MEISSIRIQQLTRAGHEEFPERHRWPGCGVEQLECLGWGCGDM